MLSAIDKRDRLCLVHCHRFTHGTECGNIIGYAKDRCSRWERVHAVWIDRTGLGEYLWEDMSKALPLLHGVVFT
ncbi:MAG: hypothetical protein ACE5Z5_09830 [Candidatus Bathyarchaeia archaeon]